MDWPIFPPVLIAGFFIYFFDSRYAFKKLEIPVKTKKRMALILAIVSAPWLMMLPLDLWYSFLNMLPF